MSDNIESGMVFKKTPEGFFNVEKSPTIRSIGEGVKTCEFFIRLNRDTKTIIWLLEAKSSAPKPPAFGGGPERWKEYGEDIYEKMVNSLLVYLGLRTGRTYTDPSDLPPAMDADDLGTLSIIPCLVLRDHPDSALPPVQDDLRMRLNHIVKSYRLEQPIVMNAKMAQAYGLVERCVP